MFRLARSVSHSLGSFVRLAGDLTLDGLRFLGATLRAERGERGDPVPPEAVGLLPRTPSPSATAYRLRPILPGLLVTAVGLEGGVGDRQAGDSDRLAW